MPSETSTGEAASPTSQFPTTMWSLVLQAAQGGPEASDAALRELCTLYRDPILAWLRRRGWQQPDAEDLAQGFVVFLLERNRLRKVEPGPTRFRSFLLECLLGFSRNEWRKANAQKRGGGQTPVPLEEELTPAEEAGLTKFLDRKYAVTVHFRALNALGKKFAAAGRSERLRGLQPFIFGADDSNAYAEVARTLNLSANAMKKAVFDLRDDYYDAFRAEVAQTAATREALDEEMRYLISLLADAPELLGGAG